VQKKKYSNKHKTTWIKTRNIHQEEECDTTISYDGNTNYLEGVSFK